MYRHDQPVRRPPPPPFGAMMMPHQPPPFRNTGPCPPGPPPRHLPPNLPGHLPPNPERPFLASGSHYLDSRPPRGRFVSPHCSNFSIDRSTVIALGGSQQVVPHEETPHLHHHKTLDHHKLDNSAEAGEEFLRCIAANKPLPEYLKGMAYNLADALKSANDLKEAVKLNSQFSKHVPRSKSRSRSRGRSRAKSRARSKSRDRSRNRGRSKSRVRAKSTTRARSKSRSKKSYKRSKSRVRRSRSQSSSSERSYDKEKKRKRSPDISSNSSVGSSNNVTGNSLLEGLKLVIQSKDLEDRLPTLKNALLNVQSSNEIKQVEHVPKMHMSQQHESLTTSPSLENDSMLLPHERVVSDFSWLNEKSQEEISILKAKEFEEEESFLYGTETSSLLGGHAKLLVDMKQPHQMALSTFASASLDKMECEKIKNILNSLGETSNKGKMMVQTRRQNEGSEAFPAVLTSDTTMARLNNLKALESLQSLIKVTKEKQIKSHGQPETSHDKKKVGDGEDRSSIKVKIKQMETLAKELDEILKQKGIGFISSVMGFYCQKCEEFIGDFNSAEKHAEIHSQSSSKSKQKLDKHPKDKEGSSHHHSRTSSQQSHSSERRDHSSYSHHKDSGGYRNGRDLQQNRRDEKDHKDGRTGQQNISLKEELKKERMLITVNRGLTPPPQTIRTKEERKELPIMGHGKIKTEDKDWNKSSRNGSDDDESGSSDSSHGDKSPELKHSKKKKKEKKKKKKKEKNKS
ncbi:uncharacterized protein si:ch211-195b21.5 [Austrofundulus limnaeus]|uniref:Uncharacterized protein si:ch211-195b21.5 n=1 Tax=Austrofundulus limnaeus TaxID=52670 RepID=A0A2I4ARB2_AUSLI|nr:PREDICTED: uncharacterized protein LOC106513615 [Austrofundulus limnaeus]